MDKKEIELDPNIVLIGATFIVSLFLICATIITVAFIQEDNPERSQTRMLSTTSTDTGPSSSGPK